VKVSLGAVERFVSTLPGLVDAVVIARADASWGQVPVVVTTTRNIDLAALRASVVAELGPAAGPADIIVMESIPMLASGKPDRARLAAR
jgi:O-succinylbenzoic acid--CoA ligase